ncbi:MAG: malate synthase G, partial [Pseudomonadota bacterium]
MNDYVDKSGLAVAQPLAEFIDECALPGSGISAQDFWPALRTFLQTFAAENAALLETRQALQKRLDAWHTEHPGKPDRGLYKAFLEEIGYLLPEGPDFSVTTENIDPEIAHIAGPQLVVPVDNPRYALNAANARWGSLYDALYGTDAIPGDIPNGAYDPKRGAQVIAFGRAFLDETFPLTRGSHTDAVEYAASDDGLQVSLKSRDIVHLAKPAAFAGYCDGAILLRHNQLHVELVIDPKHPIGSSDAAGLADIVLEAAVTTIMDCEDSVAAVDAADKVRVYRTWLGLMRGDLTETFEKSGRIVTRALHPDRHYKAPDGSDITLPGRSVMLVRNVGHLMLSDAVLLDGAPVPEGLLDCIITSLCALHDLQKTDGLRNSKTGSVYIVKPKMHGPDEVAFACRVMDHVEDCLGLARHTLKIGIMDEERRTTVNL